MRVYLVVENREDDILIAKTYIGRRDSVPWCEVSEYKGYVLISYCAKGDFSGFKRHGEIS